MVQHKEDTIIARATAAGVGAISVVRISGTRAIELSSCICRGGIYGLKANETRLRKLEWEGQVIDEALVSVFKGPNSFTGEDVVEFSLHGSEFIVNTVMQCLLQQGARLADAGEFTMRAYLNGKMDLAQAEAVADLIASQTSAEHQLAINQLKGTVSAGIRDLRARILSFASLVELELDFGEEDVEFADRTQLRQMVADLRSGIVALLDTFKSGNAIREGVPVVIAGKPNAGKSTLLNLLAGEEKAIVTDIPGTTRDSIEEVCIIRGLRYRFVDTAGIREADNLVERIGIDRTFQNLKKASLVWLLIDLESDNPVAAQTSLEEIRSHTDAEVWVIGNKADVAGMNENWPEAMIRISARDGKVEALIERLHQFGSNLLQGAGDTTISNLRHFEVLKASLQRVDEIFMALDQGLTGDMLAHHMRNAMSELGRITGDIDNEEILDQIFSKFCIGK